LGPEIDFMTIDNRRPWYVSRNYGFTSLMSLHRRWICLEITMFTIAYRMRSPVMNLQQTACCDIDISLVAGMCPCVSKSKSVYLQAKICQTLLFSIIQNDAMTLWRDSLVAMRVTHSRGRFDSDVQDVRIRGRRDRDDRTADSP